MLPSAVKTSTQVIPIDIRLCSSALHVRLESDVMHSAGISSHKCCFAVINKANPFLPAEGPCEGCCRSYKCCSFRTDERMVQWRKELGDDSGDLLYNLSSSLEARPLGCLDGAVRLKATRMTK